MTFALSRWARARLLSRAAPGLRLNENMEEDGPLVFHHACKLGLEGIGLPRPIK